MIEKGYPNVRQFLTPFSTFDWYRGELYKGRIGSLGVGSKHKEPANLSGAKVEQIVPQTLTNVMRKELGKDAGQIHQEWLREIGHEMRYRSDILQGEVTGMILQQAELIAADWVK